MTHINHYKIEGPAVVNFSGGRSSGYMLHQILDAHNGKLPDNVIPIFCNTGKELEETYEFVYRCETEWKVDIIWLEYRYKKNNKGGINNPKQTYEIVGYKTASRNGEPFDQVIEAQNQLPSPVMRNCTRELKVDTVKRYMYHEHKIKVRTFTSILGIRHDERKRWKRLLDNAGGCHRRKNKEFLPMVYMKNNRQDVDEFWSNNSFDLSIPSSRSNCDLCFLKSRKLRIEIMRENPQLADWWIQQEKNNLLRRPDRINKQTSYFDYQMSYEEMLEVAKQPPDLDLFDYAEENGIDCFCTD